MDVDSVDVDTQNVAVVSAAGQEHRPTAMHWQHVDVPVRPAAAPPETPRRRRRRNHGWRQRYNELCDLALSEGSAFSDGDVRAQVRIEMQSGVDPDPQRVLPQRAPEPLASRLPVVDGPVSIGMRNFLSECVQVSRGMPPICYNPIEVYQRSSSQGVAHVSWSVPAERGVTYSGHVILKWDVHWMLVRVDSVQHLQGINMSAIDRYEGEVLRNYMEFSPTPPVEYASNAVLNHRA
jgi:hypothetical protein